MSTMMILAALLTAGATVTPAAVPPVAPAPAKAAEQPSRADVLAAVKAEWPRYDTTGRGKLTPLEFSTWVIRAHGGVVAPRAHAAGISPVSAMNASSTAFARADADHDGGITPEEMVRFLMLPPLPAAKPKAPATVATTRAVGER
jgi:hypothetical protein